MATAIGPERIASLRAGVFGAALLAGTVAASAVMAQDRIPSHCIALAGPVQTGPERVLRAGFGDPVTNDSVRISYIDHATFAIEATGNVTAVTDYTGWLGGVDFVPDVVTMNHAHSSHWTDRPDPRIPHVLRGWPEAGQPAEYYLDLGAMLVRNVTTDIRFYGTEGIEPDGNSIFIFETAGLCIGHLSHLHHEPTPAQYARIGRLDVVFAPVDGTVTLDQPSMIRVMKRLRASVVIPMHWFSGQRLERFLDGMQEDFLIERPGVGFTELSLDTLPRQPTVRVLEPALLP